MLLSPPPERAPSFWAAARPKPASYSGILDVTVGFTSDLPPSRHAVIHHGSSHVFGAFAGGPRFKVNASSESIRGGSYVRIVNLDRDASNNTVFGATLPGHSSNIRHFSAGATWGSVTRFEAFPRQAGQRFFGTEASPFTVGGPSYTDKYFLFRFTGNSGTEYGWIEASMSLTSTRDDYASDGPNLTIVSYAFDNTGAIIAAGNEGATPEPSSLAETGLAALVLGAEGLWRWRKARKAA